MGLCLYMHYLFCQGRESPTCDEKRGEGKREMKHRPSDEKWTLKQMGSLSNEGKVRLEVDKHAFLTQ